MQPNLIDEQALPDTEDLKQPIKYTGVLVNKTTDKKGTLFSGKAPSDKTACGANTGKVADIEDLPPRCTRTCISG